MAAIAAQAAPYLDPPQPDGATEAVITSAYGPRGVSGGSYFHNGVDYRHPAGTTVRALEGGTVNELIWISGAPIILRVNGQADLRYIHMFYDAPDLPIRVGRFGLHRIGNGLPAEALCIVEYDSDTSTVAVRALSTDDNKNNSVQDVFGSGGSIVITAGSVTASAALGPAGTSGGVDEHLHVGVVPNTDSPLLYIKHPSGSLSVDDASTFPSLNAVVYHTADHAKERVKFRVLSSGPSDWLKGPLDLNRVSFVVAPSSTPQLAPSFSAVSPYIINAGRNASSLVPTDATSTYKAVFNYGGWKSGDKDMFPAFLDKFANSDRLGISDGIRTGAIPVAGRNGGDVTFVFNNWNSRIKRDYGGDAVLPDQALYPDGSYVLAALAEDIDLDGVVLSNLNHKIVIDNFRPYLKGVVAKQNGGVVYQTKWEEVNGILKLKGGNLKDVYPQEVKNSAGLELVLSFSEMLPADPKVMIGGITLGPWTPVDATSTTWKAVVPAGIMRGIPADSDFRLEVAAKDLAGNDLYAFDEQREFSDVEKLGRAPDGTMPSTGGADTLHRLAAPFSAEITPMVASLSHGVSRTFQVEVTNRWMPAGGFELETNVPPVPGVTSTLGSLNGATVSVGTGQTGSRSFTVMNSGASGASFGATIDVKRDGLTFSMDTFAPTNGGGGIGGGAGGGSGLYVWFSPPMSANHPDDNLSVADARYSTPWLIDTAGEVGVLLGGYADGVGHILGKYNLPTAIVGEDLGVWGPEGRALSDLKALVIASGGLAGKNTGTFREKLKSYVSAGGTLVVLDQPLGEDFGALPRGSELGAYGWDQDQSCFADGVYLAADHPVLYGQTRGTVNVSVDGYFSKVPDGATVILRRSVNQAPALIEYTYGQGRVIVGTIFPDWGAGHGQWSDEAARLTRDVVLHALNRGQIAKMPPNSGGVAGINVQYRAPPFAEDIPRVSSVEAYVYGSNGLVLSTSSFPVDLGSGNSQTLSVPLSANGDMGLARVGYLLKALDGSVVQEEAIGGVYGVSVPVAVNGVQPGAYEMWVTVASENVVRGSAVTYDIHVRNNTNANLEDMDVAVGGHEKGGDFWAFYGRTDSATVPAHGQTTFSFQRDLNLSTAFYFGLNTPGETPRQFLSGSSLVVEKGMWASDPAVNVSAVISPTIALPGEQVALVLDARNTGVNSANSRVAWRLTRPDGTEAVAGEWPVGLGAGSTGTFRTTFDLPSDAVWGKWLFSSRTEVDGRRLGAGSKALDVRGGRTTLNLSAPSLWRAEGTPIHVTVHNPDAVPAPRGLFQAELISPNGTPLWISTAPLAPLSPGESFSYSLTPASPGLEPGIWKFVARAIYSGGETILTETLPLSAIASVTADKPSYNAGDMASIDVEAVNLGRWDLSGIPLSLSIPSIHYDKQFLWPENGETTLNAEVPIPADVAGGTHSMSVGLESGGFVAIGTATLVVPMAEAALSLSTSAWRAGLPLRVAVRNAGGAWDSFRWKAELKGDSGILIAGREGDSVPLGPGGEEEIFFSLPASLLSGGYTLSFLAKAGTGPMRALNRYLSIQGSDVSLTAFTDKLEYAPTEPMQISGSLSATGPVEGTLDLKITAMQAGWKHYLDADAYKILMDGDFVWFMTTAGVVRRYQKSKDRWDFFGSNVPGAPRHADSLAADADSVWFFGQTGLIRFRKDSGTWGSIFQTNTEPSDGGVTCTDEFCGSDIFSDGQYVWMAGDTGDVYRVGIGDGQLEIFSANAGTDRYSNKRRMAAQGAYLWIPMSNGYPMINIDQVNLQTGDRTTIDLPSGAGGSLMGLAADERFLWLSMHNGSAYLLRYERSTGIWTRPVIGFSVGSIHTNGKDLLAIGFGASGPAAVFMDIETGDILQELSVEDGLQASVTAAAFDDDQAWFSYQNNPVISRFDRQGPWKNYGDDFSPGITNLATAPGEVWASGFKGLSRLDVATDVWTKIQVPQVVNPDKIAADEAEVWLSGYYGDLVRMRKSDGDIRVMNRPSKVVDMTLIPGELWILTSQSVWRYDRVSDQWESWPLWPDAGAVYSMAVDRSGDNLWVYAAGGIGRFDRSVHSWTGIYTTSGGMGKIVADGGEAWAKSWGQLSHFDSQTDRWEEVPFPHGYIMDMCARPSEVLFLASYGAAGAGIARWDRLSKTWKWQSGAEGFLVSDGSSIAVDDRYAWINMGSALTRYEYAGSVLWETHLMVNGASISTNESLPPLGLSGRFLLEGTFASAGPGYKKEVAQAFYVRPGDVSLRIEPEKPLYRAGESVNLIGRLENHGLVQESGTILVSSNGETLFTQVVTLAPGEGIDLSASFVADHTRRITASFNEFKVDLDVQVETPRITATLVGPDSAGLEPFMLSLLLKNEGSFPASAMVDFAGDVFPVTLAGGETTVYDQDFSITEDVVFRAVVSGGAVASAKKTVHLGPAAVMTARPDPVYVPGATVVPFTLSNGGNLPFEMDIRFVLNGSTVTRRLSVPAGGAVEDSASWDAVPEGTYVMTYDSVLAKGSAVVLVAPMDVARVEDCTAVVATGTVLVLRVTGRIVNAGANAFEGSWRLDGGVGSDEGTLSLPVGASLAFDRSLPLNDAAAGLYAVRLDLLRGGNVSGAGTAQVLIAPVWQVVAVPAGPVTAGQPGSVVVSVSNVGPVGGLARAALALGDLLDDSRTQWVAPGDAWDFTLAFTPAEDLEEKTYSGLARVTDESGGAATEARFDVPLLGHKVESAAAWDTVSYAPGGTAQLTVTARSLNALTPGVYVKVHSDFFEMTTATSSLTSTGESWTFDLPVPDGEWSARTVTYGVYAAATGRALRLDTVYLYRASSALPVVMDRFLLNPGETFTGAVIPAADGLLEVSLPGTDWQGAVPGGTPHALSFTLPAEMAAGTYSLALRFTPTGSTETIAAAYPFDVAGYRVTVKEARLPAPDPMAGTTVPVLFRVDAGQDLDPVVLTGFLSGQPLFVSTMALRVGEGVYQATVTLPADVLGAARVSYALERPRSGAASLVLAAGSFDVDIRAPGTLPAWADVGVQVSTGLLAGIVPVQASVTEGVAVARVDFLLDGVLISALPGGPGPFVWNWDTSAVPDGAHTLSAMVYDRDGGAGGRTVPAVVNNAAFVPGGGGYAPDPLQVKDIYVYPNPVRSGRLPKVRMEGDALAGWFIRIYDEAGGLAHEVRPAVSPSLLRGENGYDYVWDDGGAAPGAYLCVVEVLGAAGEKETRTFRFSLAR